MKIRVHRGGNEIGGNCVEVHADGASILLDLGEPLMGEVFGEAALPDVEGLPPKSSADRNNSYPWPRRNEMRTRSAISVRGAGSAHRSPAPALSIVLPG